MSDDHERLALCSDIVDNWLLEQLGDVEAMLAIALITRPGLRTLDDVAEAIRSRLEVPLPN